MKSKSIALAWPQDLLALYSASDLNRFIQEAFRILPPERLGKTVAAVKFLLHRVYKKLGVANRAKLALAFSVAPGVSPTAG